MKSTTVCVCRLHGTLTIQSVNVSLIGYGRTLIILSAKSLPCKLHGTLIILSFKSLLCTLHGTLRPHFAGQRPPTLLYCSVTGMVNTPGTPAMGDMHRMVSIGLYSSRPVPCRAVSVASVVLSGSVSAQFLLSCLAACTVLLSCLAACTVLLSYLAACTVSFLYTGPVKQPSAACLQLALMN
jgi:hypothetical protein